MTNLSADTQIRKLAACISEIPNGTLQEIADKAGISRATLYRNYGTKDGLKKSIEQTAISAFENITNLAKEDYSNFEEGIKTLVQAHINEYELFSYLYSFQETWEWSCWDSYCDTLDKFFLHWQEKGAIKLKFSALFLTEMFFSSIYGLLAAMKNGRIASKGMEETFQDFFLNGIISINNQNRQD